MNAISKLAVTGASGFIGRHVAEQARRRGWQVNGLSRRESSDLIVGEITDPAAVRRVIDGSDAVVHLAGVAHSELRSEAEKKSVWNTNVEGTRIVLQAAEEIGVQRVVVVSSAHVYRQQSGLDVAEDAPVGGQEIYAQTKIAVEEAARQSRCEVIIARPCLTYGPGVRFNLWKLLRALDRGYYMNIRGSNPLRSFLSVHNAAAALLHLVQAGVPGQAYNLADESPQPLEEFVNDLARRMGRRQPRKLPLGFMRGAATVMSPFKRLGLPVPLEHRSLEKLTSSFTLRVERLRASGFVWPDRMFEAKEEMVRYYLSQCGMGSAA